jgi:murein DD-endopeptidase MepM/ murein hydrolase activator NlpD
VRGAPPAAIPPADSLADSLATGHGAGVAAPSRPGAPAATATAAELSALAARLVVPVAGVRPEQLVDSYDDARGAQSADGEGSRRHDALDILAPRGTPVVAATAGRVLKLFDSRRGGLTVYTTDESERFVLLYAHLDRYAPALREGARVRQGETIGYVGTTGNANPATPHLHFAIARTDDPSQWWQGTPVNPYPLLRGR